MPTYQELKKIRHDMGHGSIMNTTQIADHRGDLIFTDEHSRRMGPSGNIYEVTNRLTIKRSGAGVQIELTKFTEKRSQSFFVSLGKSQLALLVEYLAMIEGEVSDYQGEITVCKLEKF